MYPRAEDSVACMQIVQKNIIDLVGYDRNSRTHSEAQIREIAASIREFGFNNPILVDNDSTIVAGHVAIHAQTGAPFKG